MFTPDVGNFSGHTFLIVDLNGAAGADLVVELFDVNLFGLAGDVH